DKLGLLKVGPESAEANPGPACYGLGGDRPTVTDANLLLGYLNPDYFLGGAMRLDPDLAETAIRRHIAEPLGMSLIDAAWGIHQVASESMSSAARVHFSEKGRDPRRYALFAYGGGGPVHAATVARRLRMHRFICPMGAGVLAAFGFLAAPASFDFIRTYITRLDRADWDGLNALYEELEAAGRRVLDDAGVPPAQQTFVRSADMRYSGQLYEITAPVPGGRLSEATRAETEQLFHDTYREVYRVEPSEAPIEVLNWRLLATGPRPVIPFEIAEEIGDDGHARALKGTRRAFFGDQG